MEAQRCVQLTGTNRSFGLIALITPCPTLPPGGPPTPRDPLPDTPPPDAAQPRAARRRGRVDLRRPGGPGEAARPDPIPNSAVKRFSAHGTVPQGPGESVAARPAKIDARHPFTRPRPRRTRHGPPQRPPRRCRQPASPHGTPDGDAGWSSPVARQAHNLKAAGSNPAPATNLIRDARADPAASLDPHPKTSSAATAPRTSIARGAFASAGERGEAGLVDQRAHPLARHRRVLVCQGLLQCRHPLAIRTHRIRHQPRCRLPRPRPTRPPAQPCARPPRRGPPARASS